MMTHRTIRSASYLGCLVVPLMLAGCQQDPAENAPVATTSPAGQSTAPSANAAAARDTALVRMVHAIPGGPSVDVFADDMRAFNNMAFKAVTPYRELDGQHYTFRLRAAGVAQGDGLASNGERLNDGDYYSVFAVPGGDGEAAQLRVVEDDHSSPAAGKARVRVVHAARGAGELDLFVAGTTNELFDGIDFQSVTDHDEIDPVMGALELRSEGSATTILSMPDVRLEAGKSYTIVVVGGGGGAKLEAFVIEDHAIVTAPAAN